MKKIIVLFICVVVLFNATSFQVMASQPQIESDYFIQANNLISALEIMPSYDSETFNGDEFVTRGEFLIFLSKITDSISSDNREVRFSDIPSNYSALGTINMLVDMGILSGYSDGTFGIDNNIRLEEAYKVLLSLAGYDSYAKASGGYPLGYWVLATRFNLGKGMNSSTDISKRDMIVLLYNFLNMKVMNAARFGTDYIEYSNSSDETFLSKYKNIYTLDGRVTAVEGSSFTGRSYLKDNEIRIDDILYQMKNNITQNLFGLIVKVYYSHENDSDKRNIICISEIKERNNVVEIDAENIVFVGEDYSMIYQSSANAFAEKSLRVAAGASVIYNGVAVDSYTPQLLEVERGHVRLISTYDDNIYDIVIIEEYENFIVSEVDSNNLNVYDKYGIREMLDLSDNSDKVVKILARDNTRLDFTAIQPRSILSVYRHGNDFYKIYVSSKMIEGIASEIQRENDTYTITVGDIRYKVDESYIKLSTQQNDDNFVLPVTIGDTVEIMLDVYDEVVEINSKNASYKVAYYIKMSTKVALSETVQIKLFGENNEMMSFDVGERLTVDGALIKSGDIKSYFQALSPQLIRYKLNADGKVDGIDTVYHSVHEGNNTLQVNIPRRSGSFRAFGLIEPKCLLDTNTKVFMVPEDNKLSSSEDWEFAVLGVNRLVAARTYTFESYRTTPKASTEQILLIKGDDFSRIKDDADVILVDKIVNALNAEEVPTERLYGYCRGSAVKYEAASGFSFTGANVNSGDLIRVNENARGEIINLTKFYDFDAGTKPTWAPVSAAFDAIFRLSYGFASDKVDTILKLSYEPGDDYDEVYNLRSPVIMVYDGSKRDNAERIYMGTINDITTYNDSPADCSKIIVQAKYSDTRVVVVYK